MTLAHLFAPSYYGGSPLVLSAPLGVFFWACTGALMAFFFHTRCPMRSVCMAGKKTRRQKRNETRSLILASGFEKACGGSLKLPFRVFLAPFVRLRLPGPRALASPFRLHRQEFLSIFHKPSGVGEGESDGAAGSFTQGLTDMHRPKLDL